MARQKLLTKEILKDTPALYSQDKVKDPVAHAKFFNPCGDGTWYMTELDPETRLAFGKVVRHGDSELGYFSLDELESVKLRFGLYIERDIHFTPKPLSQCN